MIFSVTAAEHEISDEPLRTFFTELFMLER